jgi:hypothetical protein
MASVAQRALACQFRLAGRQDFAYKTNKEVGKMPPVLEARRRAACFTVFRYAARVANLERFWRRSFASAFACRVFLFSSACQRELR